MSIFDKIKIALKLKAVWDAILTAQKEGTLANVWSVLLHVLALSAPAVAGALVPILTGSHNPILVAIGTALGALVPLLKQSPIDPPKP